MLNVTKEKEMTKPFEQVTLLTDDLLTISVNIGRYKLYKGYEATFGLPVENFVMLYAVLQGEILAKISSPLDLSAIVQEIKSIDDAIAFLALFTSPKSHFLFPAYKNTINLFIAESETSTAPGTISQQSAQDIDLYPDTQQEISGHFLIERNLVTCSEYEMCDVFRIKESLSRSGGYNLISREMLGRISRGEIHFPEYEEK